MGRDGGGLAEPTVSWRRTARSPMPAGRSASEIEDRTDRLGLQPYEAIGEDGCAELRSLVRPWSKAIVSGDDFGFAR